jgi:Domain of unknown function (DUF4340)
VVEAALMPAQPPSAPSARRWHNPAAVVAPLAGALLIALLAALALSGHSPDFKGLLKFTEAGIVTVEPADVTHVEIRSASNDIALKRAGAGWVIEGASTPSALTEEISSHVERGLRFLRGSEPAREISAKELTASSYAEFGLDPPASVVAVRGKQGAAATLNFGVLNPAGTSQYVRLGGAATVYLLPRHVGNEWQVTADMLGRLAQQAGSASRSGSLLLPVSIAQVWALEIVHGGKFSRFERDPEGNWFLHLGEHSHTNATVTHVADPAKARIIAGALEAFDQTVIETHVTRSPDDAELKRFGLALPPVIVMFYARDSSTRLARLELGAAANDFSRYARLAPDGEVVTVAEFEVKRLTELLKALGAGS